MFPISVWKHYIKQPIKLHSYTHHIMSIYRQDKENNFLVSNWLRMAFRISSKQTTSCHATGPTSLPGISVGLCWQNTHRGPLVYNLITMWKPLFSYANDCLYCSPKRLKCLPNAESTMPCRLQASWIRYWQ